MSGIDIDKISSAENETNLNNDDAERRNKIFSKTGVQHCDLSDLYFLHLLVALLKCSRPNVLL